jgi:transposase InsO family protein
MYGSRNIAISPFKVLKHMKASRLSSFYNKKIKFKPYPNKVKSATLLMNELEKIFQRFSFREIINSDLTYIPFQNKYLYVCFVIDLYNREIVAHGVSHKHDPQFVYETLGQINLYKVGMFHSDHGSEFINHQICKLLEKTNTVHSVAKGGCPYE